ncbi:MAG: PQQ-binding-like beta-propeller repeat protein [Planctomycetota bacterium]
MSRLLGFLALVLFPLSDLRAQVYVQEDENFRNSAFVRESEEANASLFFADLRSREESWAEAVNAYQQVLDNDSDEVVALGPRVYLSGAEAVRRRLEALPDEGRQRYVELFSQRARDARAMALRLFDVEGLMRVAERYPFTPAADEALHLAAELAFEVGSLTGVARATDRLLRDGSARASDLARYAHLLAQDLEVEALRELRQSAAALLSHPVVQTDAETTLGQLIERLLGEVTESGHASAARQIATGPLRVGIVAQLPLEERSLAPPVVRDPLWLSPYRYLSCDAAVVDEQIWVAGLMGLYRYGPRDPGDQPLVPYSVAFGHDPDYLEISSRSLRPTVSQGLLYLALNQAEISVFGGPADEFGQVVCVDARADGKTVFQSKARALGLGQYDGYVFEGPPVVFGDLLILSASRVDTSTECSLFALDRLTGKLRWSRFLASANKVSHYDSRNRQVEQSRAAPSPVVLADGVVYCVTNVGVVAAVDALTGNIHWLFRYNRISPDDTDRYEPQAFYDTGGWPRSAPEVVGGRLIVAPEDSRFLYVLARHPSTEGYLRLNDPTFKGDHRAFLGVDRARELLLFADELTVGPHLERMVITATNFDGSVVFESTPLEVEEKLTGRPLILDRRLLLPTSKALYRIDLDRDLLIVDSIPVPERLLRARESRVFGNLGFDGRRAISTSSTFVLSIQPGS